MKKILAYLSICIALGILIWSYILLIDLRNEVNNISLQSNKQLVAGKIFYLRMNIVLIFLYIVSSCIRYRKTIFK